MRSYNRELLLCLLLTTVVEVGLRIVPLPALAGRLGVRLAAAPPDSAQTLPLPAWTRVPIAATERVMRSWPAGPRGKCLRRSLVLGHRLRGLGPELVLGARQGTSGVEAHAWLAVAGGAIDLEAAGWRPFRAAP
jgi:hypothetical protein